MRLFDLTQQYNDLLDMFQEDADNEALQTMLDGMEGKIEEKIENTVKVMKTLEATIEAIDNEMKRLAIRRTSLSMNVDFLKKNIAVSMQNLGIERVKGTLHTISFRNNPHKVQVLDETCIPELYWNVPEVKPQLDKRRLLDALKNGEYTGPGATMIQERSLQIK